MGSSDDEKDANAEVSLPKELGHYSESKSTKFVEDVLKGPNESCLENFRMDKQLFYKLCDMLRTRGLLRHTNRIKIEEQLAIFMFIVGHNLRTRAVQDLFRYSGETISRHFNNVLNAIMTVSLDFFQPPKSDVPPEIREDARFYPYFLVRERLLKFNIIDLFCNASCKYYLVDGKYANIPGFMAPYPGVSYSQLEFVHSQDARELFNQRHCILRSVTDRTFAALKERFPILLSAPSYPLATQVKLVVAACALHNYIRIENPDDWIFKMYEQEATTLQVQDPMPPLQIEPPLVPAETQLSDIPVGGEELEHASQVRDAIATDIWNDYIRDFAAIDDVV
ncbi:hypothetical protein DH2020_025001 [Rehmannia glutinosa]|uniref:DDE Tnp4 domain-containing protein n=1 Tax=Rehmannia glutinosa TaxID=99300 RepID=A0ABR0W0Y2_REHGL